MEFSNNKCSVCSSADLHFARQFKLTVETEFAETGEGEGGFYLPHASFFSLLSFLLVLPKIRGRGEGPSPRSATSSLPRQVFNPVLCVSGDNRFVDRQNLSFFSPVVKYGRKTTKDMLFDPMRKREKSRNIFAACHFG